MTGRYNKGKKEVPVKQHKIAVIGTGAMGSIYAALMAEAGHIVWAVDTWVEQVRTINERGLQINGASGNRIIKGIQAVSNVDDAEPCDIYIIATKVSDLGAAAHAVAKVVSSSALVITIQNGLGAGERIAKHMSAQNVLLGVADGFGASMTAPGIVYHNAMKLIRLGEMSGGITKRLIFLTSLWRDAGFNAEAFENIQQLVWEKFLCNVTLSAPCTVFDCTLGELMASPEWRAVAIGCMREAHACGLAKGIEFSFEDPVEYVTNFVAMMPSASPSMRLDHIAQRVSEIESLNGIVPKIAASHGLSAPYNQTLSAIVRARESLFEKKLNEASVNSI